MAHENIVTVLEPSAQISVIQKTEYAPIRTSIQAFLWWWHQMIYGWNIISHPTKLVMLWLGLVHPTQFLVFHWLIHIDCICLGCHTWFKVPEENRLNLYPKACVSILLYYLTNGNTDQLCDILTCTVTKSCVAISWNGVFHFFFHCLNCLLLSFPRLRLNGPLINSPQLPKFPHFTIVYQLLFITQLNILYCLLPSHVLLLHHH